MVFSQAFCLLIRVLRALDANGEKVKAAAEKVLKGGPIISQNFQYGGSFEEDEEVYMSPEELEQFLKSGGQVEYL